jgi:ribosome biogenesis protein Tsr3
LILSKFKWGPSFFSLNQQRLEDYYLCNNHSDESLKEAETKFLKDMEDDRAKLAEHR